MEIPLSRISVRVSRTYDTRCAHEDLDLGYSRSADYQNVCVRENRKLGFSSRLACQTETSLQDPNIMIEDQLKSLSLHEVLDLLNRVLSSRDEVSTYRRPGLRIAAFVYYHDEPVMHELVGIADWHNIDSGEKAAFAAHFSQELVQSGTYDNCRSEIASYAKRAICPVCDAHVEST